MLRCQGFDPKFVLKPDDVLRSAFDGMIGNSWSVPVIARIVRRLLAVVNLRAYPVDDDGNNDYESLARFSFD